MPLGFQVDGRRVEVPDDGSSLLEVLRDRLGLHSAKDGCSPQGQCGCCTVLVDGSPRVSCVTPARRVAGRAVTTLDGLPEATRQRWADAFCATGASQCGFCTPGIIVRLAAAEAAAASADAAAASTDAAAASTDAASASAATAAASASGLDQDAVERALMAHLCRCTGWRTIVEAATTLPGPIAGRDLAAAARRATLEGGNPQRVGPDVALGHGGFADDLAPADALVAVPDAQGQGGWAFGQTLAEARTAAGGVPGRRSGTEIRHPLELPPGDWAVTLRTTWVEPAYVETDASWCRPGGQPATALGNGGAFGAKSSSPAPAAARRLADEQGRPVRVVLSREDTVRLGPKRPPVAAGIRPDGTGIIRVVRTPGIAQAIAAVAPGLTVEEVDVAGPPTSASIRAAGWAEAAVLLATAAGATNRGGPVTVVSPAGAIATAQVAVDPTGRPSHITIHLDAGEVLDAIVLRSYAIGAAHMAVGWVCREAIAVDDQGVPRDLTIRSFGVLRAVDTPPIDVTIEPSHALPKNGSDAVFAAVAAATWMAQGCPPDWPTQRTTPRTA